MKSKLILALKILISLALCAFLLTRVELKEIWHQLQKLSWHFIVLIMTYYAVLQLISCLRWQIVLRATGHLVTLKVLFTSYFAGMFLNLFLPGSFGGDIYRVYRVAQKTKDAEAALVSVFLERFTGLAALSMLALCALPFAFVVVERWDIILIFLITIGVLVGGILLILSPKLLILSEPWLQKFRLSSLVARLAKMQVLLIKFARHRQALFYSIGLSFIFMLGIVYYHYLIAEQLKISISYLQLLVFVPIVAVITLLPISLGGMGVKEGLWVYLFSCISLTAEQALLISVTMTILCWLLSLPGGLVLLLDASGLEQIKGKSTSF
ncbi:lysylphosphatidylglycerol synthase transmembrane domain-containing protein [Floridanema evergladense]|uniref:Lysylphosphatidylglycerol synthase transmembrane domain-containing protein n=1 Tax=Floridaenema evergladense BLCC-F167 TaxID=3153639 RepID=A0ABV4WFJ8_9CYAN